MNRGHAKILGLVWVALAFFAGAALVVGLPFFARSIPWSYEKKVAEFVGAFPGLEPCPPGPGRAAFQKIVKRIYPVMPDDGQLPLSVELVDAEEVNAFASLGGKIFVLNGLIQQAQSAEEVAGVLAHEIEHVRKRHVIQGVFFRIVTVEAIKLAMGQTGGVDPQLMSMLLNMRFSREQEAEADYEGLRRLQAGRVDVSGFRRFFERSENQTVIPDLLSDHPSPQNRAELTRQFEGGAIEPILKADEWRSLKNLCGTKRKR